MSDTSLAQQAKSIIDGNVYMTLATQGVQPWASPVYYCTDDNYNFYFISHKNSRHIQHVLQNPIVSFAIFDSQQREGEGVGVQGIGEVVQLKGREIEVGLRWYHTNFIELTPDMFEKPDFYQMFKLIPTELYVPNDNDVREKVEISTVTKDKA